MGGGEEEDELRNVHFLEVFVKTVQVDILPWWKGCVIKNVRLLFITILMVLPLAFCQDNSVGHNLVLAEIDQTVLDYWRNDLFFFPSKIHIWKIGSALNCKVDVQSMNKVSSEVCFLCKATTRCFWALLPLNFPWDRFLSCLVELWSEPSFVGGLLWVPSRAPFQG